MKLDLLTKLIEKAKSKKDGVYKIGLTYYKVKDKHLTHYTTYHSIYSCYGNFVVNVGNFNSITDTLKALKNA